ncbi:MAG: threonine-phosphate decarboxylase CobD [Anaerovibrio sp.]|uniref:threonine-phosphate decarboxylase CobD n=1 Tax=Anaerovibrio sp. TaxID=1872532 RepID=UPI0025E3F35B|nr:threonine-phosphate decarboxylase CobD [Anaerovibrio sp.]MCR5177244.1 threonine-phosphate decarboxylase CobD [Anaerovibrio sp.]
MRPFEHGGNVYSAGVCRPELYDFSANINPLGISDKVKNTIIKHVDNLVHYPDPSGLQLKQVISVHYKTNMKNIVLGNGAVELLYVYFHSRRPKRVLIPVPSFSEYERGARAAGCEVEYQYLDKADDFALNKTRLMEKIPEVDAVVLGNPNNPTGSLISRGDFEEILEKSAQSDTDLIIDESFLDFLTDEENYTLIDVADKYSNLLIIRSMTKFFAVPGLRLGFCVAGEHLVNMLEAGKDQWNVNLLAQYAGVAALKDVDYQEKTRMLIQKYKKALYERLSAFEELDVYSPTVNFIMFSVEKTGLSSSQFVELLARQNILVRDCSNYPGLDDFHIRTAVRTEHENSLLVDAIREVLLKCRNR